MGKKVYIYKLINNVNNMIYIGQSVAPEKRFKQHITSKGKSTSKAIKTAVKEYGAGNFSLEIVEECNENNFADREIYWINHYKNLGYNLYNKTKGGENPPTRYGSDNCLSKYTEEQLKDVMYLLQNTLYSYNQIAKITNSSYDFVAKINVGTGHKIDSMTYPIRAKGLYEIIADKIIDDLYNSNLTQKEIAKKYGVARSMVTMLNIGANRHNDSIEYPIRKGRTKNDN